MLNLMIVDDENIIVDDLKSGFDWGRLGIAKVYTAANITSAKEIFKSQNIPLLLCDIEMPQGSGLELLSWVREHYPGTETIFLTCHAEFNYAVEAIRKGSFDYLLKPVAYEDLEKVLLKAIKKIDNDLIINEHSRIGRYWSKYQPILVESFWLDIINRSILSTPEAIMEAANERNIPFVESMEFLLVFIKVRRYHRALDLREEKHMEFILNRIVKAEILKSGENGLIVKNGRGSFFLILSANAFYKLDMEALKRDCDNLIEALKMDADCDINCYIGKAQLAHCTPDQAEKLIQYDKDNIAFENSTIYVSKTACLPKEYSTPDFMIWTTMLAKGESDSAYVSICRHIDETMRMIGFDAEALKKFQIDFSQIIYSVLKQKNIQAHRILSDDKSSELYSSAASSIKDLKAWVLHMTDKFRSCLCMPDVSDSIVERAKKYIKQNIHQDLSRTDIAAHLHINPDYFTRLFGKEVGLSIPEFIMQERLKAAKEMIIQTDMSISEIASSVGYTNFSYFSKLFKMMFGMSPSALKICKSKK